LSFTSAFDAFSFVVGNHPDDAKVAIPRALDQRAAVGANAESFKAGSQSGNLRLEHGRRAIQVRPGNNSRTTSASDVECEEREKNRI
jgi:hypothetical protein